MSDALAPARLIFIIRHGEKPVGQAQGVEINGQRSEDSLIPRGWQRAGALARLFDPFDSPPRHGLAKPGQLIAPLYPGGNANHRTHETIAPLSELLELKIGKPYKEGQEKELGRYVSSSAAAAVVLIAWEHHLIPEIAKNIKPLKNEVPNKWPEDRFDLVWSFALSGSPAAYVFTSISQMLLYGDR